MRQKRRFWFPVLALMFTAVGLSAPVATAQDTTTTITIHALECPPGYSGNDLFGDCHDNRLAGVTFSWKVLEPVPYETVITDANGVAEIETPANSISVVESPPFALASFVVYCSTNDGADLVNFSYDEQDVGIVFGQSLTVDSVVCDWYNIPVGAPSGGEDGTDGGTQAPVTRLPSTGIGMWGATGQLIVWASLAIAAILGGVGIGLRRRTAR
jgi:hypothetical protein